MPQTETETSLTLAARVEERTTGPARVLVLPTPVQSVVALRGSFLAHPDFAAGDELVQALTVGLLDKGTRRRDRFAVAELLENRGAELAFVSEGLRVGFHGRALREDLPLVLELLAEQLRDPLFDAGEFEKARVQYRASLQRAMENTRSQASAALSRRLYRPAHPNFTPSIEESLSRLDRLTLADVRAHHEKHFGADDLVLALAGDVDAGEAAPWLEDAFGGWAAHGAVAAFDADAAPQAPGRAEVPMPGKRNVDVHLGHALALRRQDADYLPLYLACHILGGNFSGRLMSRVRDELGLTYGIYAVLDGVTTAHSGHWHLGVTLSHERVDEGLAATLAEVRKFVEEGPTPAEVDDARTNLVGSFKVGLATTGGLAATLHLNAVRRFPTSYLDDYPAEIGAQTQEDVHGAARRHFHPERLHTALAGMLEA